MGHSIATKQCRCCNQLRVFILITAPWETNLKSQCPMSYRNFLRTRKAALTESTSQRCRKRTHQTSSCHTERTKSQVGMINQQTWFRACGQTREGMTSKADLPEALKLSEAPQIQDETLQEINCTTRSSYSVQDLSLEIHVSWAKSMVKSSRMRNKTSGRSCQPQTFLLPIAKTETLRLKMLFSATSNAR